MTTKTIMDWYDDYERWVYTQEQLTPMTQHTYCTHAKRFAKWVAGSMNGRDGTKRSAGKLG